MNKNDLKYCPRCNQLFECKLDNITRCRCFGIVLNDNEKKEIKKIYNDCLCIICLNTIKNECLVQAKELSLQKEKKA